MGLDSESDFDNIDSLIKVSAGTAAIGTDIGVVAAGVGSVALAVGVGMSFKVGKLVGRIKRK